MDSLYLKALIAGVAFGIWPLLMNRSNLSGNVATSIYTIVVMLLVLPFAWGNLKSASQGNWWMIILAGIAGAVGMLYYNGILAEASSKRVGTLIVLMLLILLL